MTASNIQLLAIITALIALLFYFDGHQYLTLAELKARQNVIEMIISS